MRQRSFASGVFIVAALCGVGTASSAHAHIKLLKPASWLKENDLGGPQKGGPCGPGGGDDVKPSPLSNAVTTFEVGETITLEWTETVPHPGHFRVAFAKDRSELKDPELEVDGSCNYDESKLPTGAHGNVLADGLFLRPRTGPRDSTGKMFTTEIKLPDEPCEKCTLQLIQFMENHPPSCIYYHCADIKLVPKGSAEAKAGSGAEAGSGGAASPSSAAEPKAGSSAAGSAAAGKTGSAEAKAGSDAAAGGLQAGAAARSEETTKDDGGCSVTPAHGTPWTSALMVGAALLLSRLRRRQRRER